MPSEFWTDINAACPEQGRRVVVAAWEFGCKPVYVICQVEKSPRNGVWETKFYLDKVSYQLDCPMGLADLVHYWAYVPDAAYAERKA